jgi:hypothetical protein
MAGAVTAEGIVRRFEQDSGFFALTKLRAHVPRSAYGFSIQKPQKGSK